MIRFEGVSRRFGNTLVVKDLDLEIGDGELVVLVGPSGCGKTTTLKMINRLVEPSAGTISINGVNSASLDLVRLRRSIGYVIQQVGLFPHLTVAENVGTVMRLEGWDRKRIRSRVAELLELVGMPESKFGARLPRELSGGQRQRVGVARALGADPNTLLMDEPFGAIDPVTRIRLQDELLDLQAQLKKTIVFVTHDIDEAIRLGNRIALFGPDGTLAQYAPAAELLGQPASPYVEDFLGQGRMVRRLSLIRLAQVALEPDSRDADQQVGVEGTLRDALDAVLRSRAGKVAVVEAGRVLGSLDAEGIRKAAAD